MDPTAVRALLAESGPLGDFDLVTEFDDQTWGIVVGEVEVTAELDGTRSLLVLSGDAGRPAADRRAQICDALLQYNYAWRETGGTRMALDGPDGLIVQMLELPLAGLDARGLADAVATFAARLHTWREVIAAAPAEGGAFPGDQFDPTMLPGAIRA
jgi:hypothetical protein